MARLPLNVVVFAVFQTAALVFLGGPAASSLMAASRPPVSSFDFLPGFEQNRGQTSPRVQFLARDLKYDAYLTEDGPVLALRGGKRRRAVLKVKLVNAGAPEGVKGRDRLPGEVNYLKASQSGGFILGAPVYRSVRYHGVYPGIDVVYRIADARLRYDFVVHPGADPAQIRLRFEGADDVRLLSDGTLRVGVGGLDIEQYAPRIYQTPGGEAVAGGYALRANNEVAFEIEAHDASRQLIIDPTLDYSTYLGAGDDDAATAVAFDSEGAIYVAGRTHSSDFPATAGTFQPNFGGDDSDAFVAKFNADGSLAFSTFYGAENTDAANDMVLGNDGAIYVTGWTQSEFLPVDGFQNGFAGETDCFIAKFSGDGRNVTYASYLGDGDEDICNGIAVNDSGEVYAAGFTRSVDFPASDDAFQTENGGMRDAFAVKVSSDGQALVYSTLLGGVDNDTANALTIDSEGNAYLVGDTTSNDFPITGDARQNLRRMRDGFVTKLDAEGGALIYSSLLGSSGDDLALAVSLGLEDSIHVAGEAGAADFPLSRTPTQATFGGESDAFVSIFDSSGQKQIFSTFLGGRERDFARGLAVDPAGRVWVVGGASSDDFPVTDNAFLPAARGERDAFITHFERAGNGILFSTYFGGGEDDEAASVAVNSSGDAFVSGFTHSDNFPLTDNAFQTDFNDREITELFDFPSEAFAVKLTAFLAERPFTLLSSATFEVSPLAGGSIASGFGADLASTMAAASSIPLPEELADVQVQVSGFGDISNAELFFVSPEQINFVLPEIESSGTFRLEVYRGDEPVATGTARAVKVAPGLYSADQSGSGVAAAFAVQRTDEEVTRSLVFAGDPPGDVAPVPIDVSAADESALELFGTGLRFANTVRATIAGEPAEVLFAGKAPVFVGLDQVNVRIDPSLAGSGEVDVQISAEGIPSNTVTIFIQ